MKEYPQWLMTTTRIIGNIISIILFFVFIRWAGMKGIVAMLLGMTIMAVLLLSKNSYFKFLIQYFESQGHIDEIKEGEKESDEKRVKSKK